MDEERTLLDDLTEARELALEAAALLLGTRPNTPHVAARIEALHTRMRDLPWVKEAGREEVEAPGPGSPCPICGENREIWEGREFCPDCGEEP